MRPPQHGSVGKRFWSCEPPYGLAFRKHSVRVQDPNVDLDQCGGRACEGVDKNASKPQWKTASSTLMRQSSAVGHSRRFREVRYESALPLRERTWTACSATSEKCQNRKSADLTRSPRRGRG